MIHSAGNSHDSGTFGAVGGCEDELAFLSVLLCEGCAKAACGSDNENGHCDDYMYERRLL